MSIWLLAVLFFQPSLDEIAAKHKSTMNNDAIQNLRVKLSIAEGGQTLKGTYLGTRSGNMRIDIKVQDTHVFTEALGTKKAWQWNYGDAGIVTVDQQASAALKHGLELPGRFYSLAEMKDRGHKAVLDGEEDIDGKKHPIVKVTLSDGHETWLVFDAGNGRILRSRSFRAFHPDLDKTEKWFETRFADFREVDGVWRSFSNTTIDLVSGETIQTVVVESYESNVDVVPGFFEDL